MIAPAYHITSFKMDSKSSYPSDYRRALDNAFTTEEVDKLLKRTGAGTPTFVFGPLMLPSVLTYIIDAAGELDVTKTMVQATLLDHRLSHVKGKDLPVIIPASKIGQSVDGFLLFGLRPEQRGMVHQFEYGLTEMQNVRVEICHRDGGLRTLDAGAFVWKDNEEGLVAAPSRSWKIDGFLKTGFYTTMVKSNVRVELERS